MIEDTRFSPLSLPVFKNGFFENLKYDIPSGLVVFLVALPLCLGIAQASDAPLISGLIAGVVGGILVGMFSGSDVSVSGPAAGLAILVGSAIEEIGSFQMFLVSVMLAGIIQMILGILRAGSLGDFVPNSVIRGMLAAIGIVIILKQIPHALGRDLDYIGDLGFSSLTSSDNTVTGVIRAITSIQHGALYITILSLLIIAFLSRPYIKSKKIFSIIPWPLIIIANGIILNELFRIYFPDLHLTIESGHLVSVPLISFDSSWNTIVARPDFSALSLQTTYVTAITLAIVASIESLLSLEAADRLDPFKRISSTSRELTAQGIGNFISGFLGGLPVTSVVIRTSANIDAGARTRSSAIFHGLLLGASALCIPHLLNRIPLASLAVILLVTGYKLASPKLFAQMARSGLGQFLPFIVTVGGIVLTDLFIGILIGLMVGLFFVLKANYHSSITIAIQDSHYLFRFNKDMTFLNKAELKQKLSKVPKDATLILDGSRSMIIDNDILDIIMDFIESAQHKNIVVELKHIHTKSPAFDQFIHRYEVKENHGRA